MKIEYDGSGDFSRLELNRTIIKIERVLDFLKEYESEDYVMTTLIEKLRELGITKNIIDNMLKFKIIKKIEIKNNSFKINSYNRKSYTFKINSFKNLNKLIMNFTEEDKRTAKSITINKLDSIYFRKMEGNKLQIEIMDNQKGYLGPTRESFEILFEDEETLDYFIEKTKNEFDKIRPKLRQKTDRIRLKILQIDKVLVPLENKVRDLR